MKESQVEANQVGQSKPVSIDNETRVDDFAIEMFKMIGHNTLLSETTVWVYQEFKRRKDRIHPGRLSPEAFAYIDMLAGMLDGTLSFTE